MLNRTWDPDQRRLYSDLNIQIVSTKDDDCPKLARPGDNKPIPKAHLNYQGQQILLVDWNHRIAVSLDRHDKRRPRTQISRNLGMAQWLESKDTIVAYYPGEKHAPRGQQVVIECDYPFSKGQNEHLADLLQACQTWAKMADIEIKPAFSKWQASYKPVPMLGALNYTFAELPHTERVNLVSYGYDRGTMVEVLDYFNVLET